MVGKSRKSNTIQKNTSKPPKNKTSARYDPIAKEEKVREPKKAAYFKREPYPKEKPREVKIQVKNPLADLMPEFDIYVFNLPPEAIENDLWRLFGPFGAIKNVALVRDAETRQHKGFGFVTMKNHNEANQAIEILNGHSLHGRPLKISFKNEKRSEHDEKYGERGAYHLYIFNLSGKTIEDSLWKLFASFGAVKNITIMRDAKTNISKGYAFVTMKSLDEAEEAIEKLNNFKLDGRNLSVAFKGQRMECEERAGNYHSGNQSVQERGESIPLYVNNLSPFVKDEDIHQMFSEYGRVNDVNVVRDLSTLQCKGYGFVMMTRVEDAEHAIESLDGCEFEDRTIQVSFKTEKKK